MSERAYFKKNDPTVKVLLGSGVWITFTESAPESGVGVVVTDKPKYIDELRAVIKRGVGGVSEITVEEYTELQKKKSRTSSPNYREQVSVQQLRDAGRLHRSAADAIDGQGVGTIPVKHKEGTITPIEFKPVIPGFRPTSVKR